VSGSPTVRDRSRSAALSLKAESGQGISSDLGV
jgi:hypothetical protein